MSRYSSGSDGSPMQNDADEARTERNRDPRGGRWIGTAYYDEDDVPDLSDLVDQ